MNCISLLKTTDHTAVKDYKHGILRVGTAVVLLFALAMMWIVPLNAASMRRYDIRAAFVFNFALLTQWPPDAFQSPADPVNLLVFGNRRVRKAFLKIDGRKIGKRTLKVSFVDKSTMEKEKLDPFHIIFISKKNSSSAVKAVFEIFRDQNVLTIGERRDFLKLGGMVRFFNRKGRLYFKVHLNRVVQRGIRLSSRLLNLAVIVNDK